MMWAISGCAGTAPSAWFERLPTLVASAQGSICSKLPSASSKPNSTLTNGSQYATFQATGIARLYLSKSLASAPCAATSHGAENWFFLVDDHPFILLPENRDQLVTATKAIRAALEQQGITGKDGGTIDHIELCSPAALETNSSRNFVLCPGASFDRSPCGTGTSAKMACLYADGQTRSRRTMAAGGHSWHPLYRVRRTRWRLRGAHNNGPRLDHR